MVENEDSNKSLQKQVIDEMLRILKEKKFDANLLSEIQQTANRGGLSNAGDITALLEMEGGENEDS